MLARREMMRFHVNVDHVATLRNARGTQYPDPVRAAELCERAGADGITAHLREDRRHIRDDDMKRLRASVTTLLNMEMAATEEMLAIALALKPDVVTLVPERREERTTEGGLDVIAAREQIARIARALLDARIKLSLFIEPDPAQIEAAIGLGVPVVEFHTGRYAHLDRGSGADEIKRIADGAALAVKNGIEPHAGHGLTFDNVAPIAAIPQLRELNIGHFLVGEAIFTGLDASIRWMRALMDDAR